MWRPILAYERRRLDFLDWLETEIDPLAFTDADEQGTQGIAPRTFEERVLVGRRGMFIELRTPDASLQTVLSTVGGAFASFEPSAAHIDEYRAQWSTPLSAPYEVARRSLAARAVGKSPSSHVELFDAAFFMDGRLNGDNVHFDFGVVSAAELRERVSDPSMTRLGGTLFPPSHRPPDVQELPQASLYVDLMWTPEKPISVTSAAELPIRLNEIEKQITMLVTDLARSVD